MTSEEYSEFRHEAVHSLIDLNEACDRDFKIPSWPRWDYDLERGTLTFSQEGTPKVVATILMVGTTSESGGNWLWSWANANLPDKVSEPLKRVRDFGLAENISQLTDAYLPDDEHLGWALTPVAARIMNAKRANRCPGDNGFVYLIYTEIAHADLPKRSGSKQINCETHGAAYATYVCKHLVSDPSQEWFSQEPDAENRWPDAWCEQCDALFQEQGEWNEVNEKKLEIKLICHHCYEKFRSQSSLRP